MTGNLSFRRHAGRLAYSRSFNPRAHAKNDGRRRTRRRLKQPAGGRTHAQASPVADEQKLIAVRKSPTTLPTEYESMTGKSPTFPSYPSPRSARPKRAPCGCSGMPHPLPLRNTSAKRERRVPMRAPSAFQLLAEPTLQHRTSSNSPPDAADLRPAASRPLSWLDCTTSPRTHPSHLRSSASNAAAAARSPRSGAETRARSTPFV